jgi:hypothetical protein
MTLEVYSGQVLHSKEPDLLKPFKQSEHNIP